MLLALPTAVLSLLAITAWGPTAAVTNDHLQVYAITIGVMALWAGYAGLAVWARRRPGEPAQVVRDVIAFAGPVMAGAGAAIGAWSVLYTDSWNGLATTFMTAATAGVAALVGTAVLHLRSRRRLQEQALLYYAAPILGGGLVLGGVIWLVRWFTQFGLA